MVQGVVFATFRVPHQVRTKQYIFKIRKKTTRDAEEMRLSTDLMILILI